MIQNEGLFDSADVIHTYTRAEAIEDGVLIVLDEKVCKEAGITFPVAITNTAYADAIEWTEDDAKKSAAYQDLSGRLWDVLWMLRSAIRGGAALKTHIGNDAIIFSLYRMPRPGYPGGNARMPVAKQIDLKAICHGGDNGEPVITIMMPNED